MVYLPLLIAVGDSGAWSDDMQYQQPIDTLSKFGLYIKSAPFITTSPPKNIITQSWKDEQGEDTYLAPAGITHEAYDVEYTFIYLRSDGFANENINALIDTIRGKWLKIYDTYTRTGRRGVYFKELKDVKQFRRRGLRDYAEFVMVFRVNDPETYTTL